MNELKNDIDELMDEELFDLFNCIHELNEEKETYTHSVRVSEILCKLGYGIKGKDGYFYAWF